jgi:AcrR family transcriptional regulator
MPKETFFNLPNDKRALICSVAIEEFAAHSFKQASVNKIVAKAGIAKGSFYQYFENKKDLFHYLLQLVTQEKLNYLAPVVGNQEQQDFFTLLREMYVSGIQFALDHPQYAEFSKRLMESKGTPLYEEVMDVNMPTAYEFFERLLETAVAKNEIRADVDLKMLAYLVASMNALAMEYYTEHLASEFDDNLLPTVDRLIEILKHGIGVQVSMPQPQTQPQ